MALLAALAALSVTVSVAVGSVHIPPGDVASILANRLFGTALPEGMNGVYPAMVMDMRLPRVLLAFLTGAVLVMAKGTVRADSPPQALDRTLLNEVYGLDVAGYMRKNLRRWEE